MRYEIIFAPVAVEDLDTLDAYDRSAVADAIETHLRFEPTKVSKSRIKRLRGTISPQFRLRVEDIRVFYNVVGNAVEIIAIVPKAEANEWLNRYGEKS